MGNFGKILCLAAISLLPFSTQAQKIHESASLETSHLWRGLEVGNGLIFNNDVSLSDNNDHFKIGLWGGMATDGDYKEADVYVNYNNSGFNLAVWDLWNFSDGIPGNGKYFTLLLVFLIIAFGTKGNVYDPEGNTFGLSTLGPVPITYVIVALGMSLGGTTGYAMNPARDLAPRIAYAICPIKDKRDPDWAYSWVPVLGPVLGGAVAGLCGIWLMSL